MKLLLNASENLEVDDCNNGGEMSTWQWLYWFRTWSASPLWGKIAHWNTHCALCRCLRGLIRS